MAKAAPSREPEKLIPWARPRSEAAARNSTPVAQPGKGPRLAGPEEKPGDQHRDEAPGGAGQAREERPEGHHRRQQPARAEAIGQTAGRRLAERVAERERPHDPAPLRRR